MLLVEQAKSPEVRHLYARHHWIYLSMPQGNFQPCLWLQNGYKYVFTRFFQVKTQCFPNLNQVVFMPNQAHIVVTTLNSKLSQRISKDVVGRSVRSHIYSGNWVDLCCEWEPIQIIGHKNGQPPGSTVTSYRLMFKKKIYTQRISTNVSPTGIL